jgi:putative transcriptional regulator
MPKPLAPGLLLASPPLGDPNFDKTVVLLAAHGEDGALGFVVNRRAQLKLGQVFELAGMAANPACDSCPVFLGGPVAPGSGWVLGRDLEIPDGADRIDLSARVRVTRSMRALELVANEMRDRPLDVERKGLVVILGYSGWGPGQVEREIAAGAWLPVPFDESVLFDVDIASRWEHAYALQGLAPADLMTMRTPGLA